METLRRRIPFQTSEEGQEDDRILDEEEQEQVLEALHKENDLRTQQYYTFLQICIAITLFLQLLFLFSQRTPLHILHPNLKTPAPPLIPLSTLFTMLNIVALLNSALYLPEDMVLPHAINQIKSRVFSEAQEALSTSLPFPLMWGVLLSSLAPAISILGVKDVPQILWWAFPALVVGIAGLVISWIRDTKAELMSLEKLKYEAKGA